MEKSRDRRVLTDVETGETGVFAALPAKEERGARGEKLKPNTGFVMMWPEAMREVALSRAQWDVFSAICQLMDPRTGATMFYAQQLVDLLGYSDRSIVHRNIRELIARGALRRVPRERCVYAVNPNLAWNGKASDRVVALFVWENGRMP